MKQERTEYDKTLTVLTVFSIFLMGFIDAFTFITQDGLFASAQTGNIVVMSARLFSGDFLEAVVHVASFVGFAVGAFLAQGIVMRFKDHGWRKYRTYLFLQVIFLMFVALLQDVMGAYALGFLLGLLAGYELTVFRKIQTTSINNGIMTGNAKNMMNNLYLAIFHNDRAALSTFMTLLAGLLVFMLGAGAGAFILLFGEHWNLWAAFLLNLIFYIWLLIKKD